MSVSQAYRDRVMEQLAPVGAIRARSLFGEVGLYADDLIFGLIVDDAVYFKVDDANRADYEAEGISPFVAPWSGKPTAYYEVPDAVLEDPKRLGAWIEKAVEVAARKPKKKKR
ncbi:MAG TPA: TfoX/Sxy family protein [Chloroflexia bacterium]